MTEARFTRFEELKAEAASVLKLPIDADNVVLLAALRLQHQSMVEGLVAGRTIDATELLRVTEAIAKYAPTAEPLKVTIQICQTLFTRCRKCGNLEEAGPLPPLDHRRADPKPLIAADVKAKPKPFAAGGENIVPLKPRSVHDGAPNPVTRT